MNNLTTISFVALLVSASPAFSETASVHVRTGPHGLWDGDPSKGFFLTADLVLGKEDGNDAEILGRPGDIAVTNGGDMFVLDSGFYRVQKFNSAGRLLASMGHQGEGPGEFQFPTAITVDDSDNVYVADRRFLKIFSSRGEYQKQLELEVSGGLIWGVELDRATGWIYESSLDILEQKVIHVFDRSGLPVLTFCDSFGKGTDLDVRVERALGGGAIDIDGVGTIYYTQHSPYEVRTFGLDGTLMMSVTRENDFMSNPKVVARDDGSMTMELPPTSYSIVTLPDGKFINVVRVPAHDNAPTGTIVDLFDSQGQLLTTARFGNIIPRCCDRRGRLYAIDNDEFPRVTRFLYSYVRK